MKTYNGTIPENFLKAEIEFQVELPEFCENQKFSLSEENSTGVHSVEVYELLLNDRESIVKTDNGIATYTGRITPTNIETVIIAQVIITKDEVAGFSKRKFMLGVL